LQQLEPELMKFRLFFLIFFKFLKLMNEVFDTIIIGGGQSGLASGYYLKKAKLNYLILDQQEMPGGAWLHTWDSLTLFSPAEYSSLPGWMMPKSENKFPTRNEVINYLNAYEKHYAINIQRSTKVVEIVKEGNNFKIITNETVYFSKTVVSCTGTWGNPFIPDIDGKKDYLGIQIHSRDYKNPYSFVGLKTLIIGEGNSGAQIVAEVSKVTNTKWSTHKNPEFLPDEVDGFYLFNLATAKYKAAQEGKIFDASQYSLGNIVMVPPVQEAKARGVLISSGSIRQLFEHGVIWENGVREEFDAIIWCTGFGFNTYYLKFIIKIDARGIAHTKESRSLDLEGLWLVGYGSWTGYASSTLIGLNRTTKQTVLEIVDFLRT
jgi:putative flavoprotein involved in K+ transport